MEKLEMGQVNLHCAFHGEGAYKNFKKLALEFYKDHVYKFVALTLDGDPKSDDVVFTAEFRRVPGWGIMVPPPCFKADGDGCAYQCADGDDEPIAQCKQCPLCCADKHRHHRLNPPLTLAELREMGGEPVWVEIHENRVAEWCVAKFDALMERTRLWCVGGGWYDTKNYGDGIFVYRCKPEEPTP